MKTRLASRLRTKAFTLVETLIAMGIFGMIMLAIYASWSAIMRGTRVGLTAASEVQRTRVAIHALEESLGSAVMYADNAMYYSFFADTAGNFAYLSFVARLPQSFPGSGLFEGQSLRRVTFQVDKEKNLILSQSALLDISDKPYTIKLAPNARVFAAEFYNPRKNEWLPEWIATNQLPTMVRVAIDFGQAQGNKRPTIRSIPLTAMAISRIGAPNQPVNSVRRAGQQGTGNGDGALDVIGGAGDMPSWQPQLPSDWGANRGTLQQRNTDIFGEWF
jgi:prepilin-type N-terminal cleavage/methylation domain-containing protein